VNVDTKDPVGDPSPERVVILTAVAARCNAGECPTLYRTSRGTLVVQGYRFEPAEAGMTVPDGEGMVEIPPELLAELARTEE
jgi:hypothetical protein